jgi:hypothetical protein
MLRKTTPTKTKYKELFPSASSWGRTKQNGTVRQGSFFSLLFLRRRRLFQFAFPFIFIFKRSLPFYLGHPTLYAPATYL